MAARLRLFFRTSALVRNKSRSVVTVVCLALTVVAFATMLALQSGAAQRMRSLANDNGEISLVLNAGTTTGLPNRGGAVYPAQTLDSDDMAALGSQYDEISSMIPTYERFGRLEFEGGSTALSITGTTPQYRELRNYRLAWGRFFDDFDVDTHARVVVLGQTVLDKLVPDKLPLDKPVPGRDRLSPRDPRSDLADATVQINGHPYTVIGLLQRRGISGEGLDLDNVALIPISTAQRRLDNVGYLTRVFLLVPIQYADQRLNDSLNTLLEQNHNIGAGRTRDFAIISPIGSMTFNRTNSRMLSGLFNIALAIVMLVSLVGVIGVSVLNGKERFGEVGLRRAVGARGHDIMLLLLVENSCLGLAGALAGGAVSAAVVYLLRWLARWDLTLDYAAVVIPLVAALALSLLISFIAALSVYRVNIVAALSSS